MCSNLSGANWNGKWRVLDDNKTISKKFGIIDLCEVELRTSDEFARINICFSDKVISLDITQNILSNYYDHIISSNGVDKVILYSNKYGTINLIKYD